MISVEDADEKINITNETATISVGELNIDFTFNNNNACSNTDITFTSSVNGTSGYSYVWDFDDEKTSSNGNPLHQFTALGCGTQNFNVKLTVTDAYGCSKSITKVISVEPKPDLLFRDLNAASYEEPFNNCGKNAVNPEYTIKIDNNSPSKSCIKSYNIDWGDGSSANNVTFPLTHTYLQLGSFNMIITANGNTCNNSITYLVKNSSNPAGSITNPGSTTDLCTSNSKIPFTITDWALNPPDTKYRVEYGDGTIEHYTQDQLKASTYYNALNPASSQNYPIPHTYTESNCPSSFYTAFLYISTSCTITESTTSVSPITIYKKPEVDFSMKPISCLSNPVNFTNLTSGGYSKGCNTVSDYHWDFGDGNTSTLANPSHKYSASGNYQVTLYATNYCGQTDPVTKIICIEPQLTPTFTLNTDSGCAPLSVQTTNTIDLSSSCGNETYLWEVIYKTDYCETGSGVWNFTNGTDKNSKDPSFNFTTPGTYTLKLTATNSCGSFSTTKDIIVKSPPNAKINNISNSCGPTSITPSATVNTCAPASETMTYSWSFPGGTPASSSSLDPGTITYTTSGNYTVTFEVTNSCGTFSTNKSFSINTIPSITNTDLTQTICSGTSTDEVTLTSNIANTTYMWTATAPPGVTGFTASGNTVKIPSQTIYNTNSTSQNITYVITPTSEGCSGTPVNLIITVNPAPSFTSQPQPETVCLNGSINPLSVSVNGPSAPTYKWYRNTINSNTGGTEITGETTSNYTPPNDTAGIVYYYAEASFTSGAGCNEIISSTAKIEVVDNIQINTNPTPSQNICSGGSIPTLTIAHSGGTGTVTYQWYSNTTSSNTSGIPISGANSINYLPPVFTTTGKYYYYVVISSNGSGCDPITSDLAEIIVVVDPIITTQPLDSQTLCQGTTPLNLEVIPEGGIGGTYEYQWYRNSVNSTSVGTLISGATTNAYTPPTATVGSVYYYVIVSQLGAGCSVISNTSEVKINAAPTFTAKPISNTYCLGDSLNPLTISHANGVGTPTYQWYSNSTNDIVTGTLIPGENGTSFNPPSGTVSTTFYYAIITFSSGGCTEITSNIAEITINQTPKISSKSETICSGNAFTFTPDIIGGDIIPIGTTYTWTNPIINPVGSISGATNQSNPQTTISQILTNTTLNPSTVTYTVTPKSGTCIGNDFTVTITVNPSISITSAKTNSNCYLSNSGAINISITGGIPFSTGNPYQILWTGPNGFNSSNEDISNLEPGRYTLTINDDGGCPFEEIFTITEPDELIFSSIDFDPETISCFGANDGKINIEISGGTAPYTFNWTKNGVFFAGTKDLTNLGPGDYEITVTDAKSCTPITQRFLIVEPQKLSVNLNNQVNIICFGDATGEININTIGGRQIEINPGIFDYSYAWSGPNSFTSNLKNLTGLIAGTYNLTVTDKSGCTDTLSVILTQTDEITINLTTTKIKCYGDNNASITINSITGGNSPYTIVWSNLGSGMVQNNLSAGTYIITVTDNTNCEKKATVIIDEAPIFTINPVVKNVSCFGENDARIVLNLVGGVSPVKLVWSDDATAGVERNNIGPGTYTVTITDGTPCIITETFTITEPAKLNLSAQKTDALNCDNANSGAINLTVTGGTLPFKYTWSNGATTEDLSNIPPGNYTVNISDANGCKISETWTINRFEPLKISVDIITDFNCETKTVQQSFIAKVTGGVPPYKINWSSGTISGTNGDIMTTTQNGLFIIDVTDTINCSTTLSYNVKIPVLGDPGFNIASNAYSNYGFYSIQDPIQFTNTATGDYVSVTWDFGNGSFSSEENPTHTYIKEGNYTILQTVTYPFGCVYTKQINLFIEKGYSLIMPNAFTPNGDIMNAYFAPESIALTNMEFNIYDTWGGLIYSEIGDKIKGWNGKIKDTEAENGNYYYTLKAKTLYGETIIIKGVFVSIK